MSMLAFRVPASCRLALTPLRTFASSTPTKKKTIQQLAKEISLKNVPVLVRADLNLPRSKEDGSIVDDTRARAVRDKRWQSLVLVYVPNKVVCFSFLACGCFMCQPRRYPVISSTCDCIYVEVYRRVQLLRFFSCSLRCSLRLKLCVCVILHRIEHAVAILLPICVHAFDNQRRSCRLSSSCSRKVLRYVLRSSKSPWVYACKIIY